MTSVIGARDVICVMLSVPNKCYNIDVSAARQLRTNQHQRPAPTFRNNLAYFLVLICRPLAFRVLPVWLTGEVCLGRITYYMVQPNTKTHMHCYPVVSN